MLYGRGAGDLPTGSAVVSDIITACQRKGNHRYINFYNDEESSEGTNYNNDWESEFL